jgi:hypothetical protein
MAPKLCQNYKYGHCKYGNSCKLRHNSQICVDKSCEKYNCEKRHPRECFWYKQYGRCKFSPCSYSHKQVTDCDCKSEIDALKEQVKNLENNLKHVNENFLDETLKCDHCEYKTVSAKKLRQHIKRNHDEIVVEESERETVLEDKVKTLEKFVAKLEEKVEILDLSRQGFNHSDFSGFDKFHNLIRSNSLEMKCDQCEYVGRNVARLDKHKELRHEHKCDDDCIWRKEHCDKMIKEDEKEEQRKARREKMEGQKEKEK